MAKPPVLPIDDKQDYFDKLIEEIEPYFTKNGLGLKFEGYKDTVQAYSDLKSSDLDKCWELSRDFNMWGEYFSDLKALVEKLFLDAETEKKKEYATASLAEDSKKVANGDRLANKNPTVIALRRDRNLLQAFITSLTAKIDFCYKCHHHCKNTFSIEKQILSNVGGQYF